jgi:hypothetical protein
MRSPSVYVAFVFLYVYPSSQLLKFCDILYGYLRESYIKFRSSTTQLLYYVPTVALLFKVQP